MELDMTIAYFIYCSGRLQSQTISFLPSLEMLPALNFDLIFVI